MDYVFSVVVLGLAIFGVICLVQKGKNKLQKIKRKDQDKDKNREIEDLDR